MAAGLFPVSDEMFAILGFVGTVYNLTYYNALCTGRFNLKSLYTIHNKITSNYRQRILKPK